VLVGWEPTDFVIADCRKAQCHAVSAGTGMVSEE
jgi:hypothetical protein